MGIILQKLELSEKHQIKIENKLKTIPWMVLLHWVTTNLGSVSKKLFVKALPSSPSWFLFISNNFAKIAAKFRNFAKSYNHCSEIIWALFSHSIKKQKKNKTKKTRITGLQRKHFFGQMLSAHLCELQCCLSYVGSVIFAACVNMALD